MRRRFEIGNGHDPQFRDDTRHIREDSEWRVAGAGPGLEDRRVEITGPTDPKMTINALNSGAKVWLADQEDAHQPDLEERHRGPAEPARRDPRRALVHQPRRASATRSPPTETPTIVMRPRGWHLPEQHIRFTDRTGRTMAASGSLVDFGLYFFHNAERADRATAAGPTSTSPSSSRSDEAKLWDDVFTFSESTSGSARHDPRDRADRDAAGGVRDGGDPLRAARPLRGPQRRPLGLHLLDHQELPRPRRAVRAARPQRGHDDRAVHARSYTELLVQTCHKRGALRDRRHERVHPEPP